MPGFVIVEMSQLSGAESGNTILCVALRYLTKRARRRRVLLKSPITAFIAISLKCQVKVRVLKYKVKRKKDTKMTFCTVSIKGCLGEEMHGMTKSM